MHQCRSCFVFNVDWTRKLYRAQILRLIRSVPVWRSENMVTLGKVHLALRYSYIVKLDNGNSCSFFSFGLKLSVFQYCFLALLQEALAHIEAEAQALRALVDTPNLAPRLCHMVRSETGYGFNLHSDRSRPGQYIRSLDPASPADQAGLRPQDRLVEVGRTRESGCKMSQ